jgi:hypothetical protein
MYFEGRRVDITLIKVMRKIWKKELSDSNNIWRREMVSDTREIFVERYLFTIPLQLWEIVRESLTDIPGMVVLVKSFFTDRDNSSLGQLLPK